MQRAPLQPVSEQPMIHWVEDGQARSARWRAESGVAPHKRVMVVDETMTADAAYRLACEGTALLWRGDFQNARQMLLAMARRADQKAQKARKSTSAPNPSAAEVFPAAFHMHRLARSQRARTLGMLLLPMTSDYAIPLRRAPDLQRACVEAYGAYDPPVDDARHTDSLVSMRELLGIIGAHEWRKKGVDVPALNDRVHPHYGVFAPVRGEYVGLVAKAAESLPRAASDADLMALDIGTGTGVLAAVLAQRGVAKIIATDMDPRALACAHENIERLGLAAKIRLVQADHFPDASEGLAALIICNPPWIPARPSSPIEGAIYDPDSRMLRGFITGLAAHLAPGGEGWLILSDIAEHLGLRSRAQVLAYVDHAGLAVIDRLDARPVHPRVLDATDPLHAARAAEVTSLWRLGVR